MESRKRFRSEIDDNHVKKMFAKKRPREERESKIDNEPSTVALQAIPSEMQPKTKKFNTNRSRDIQNPSNWVKPVQLKTSRDDNYQNERISIDKGIARSQGWSRAAKTLGLALKPPKPKQVRIDEI